MVMMSAGKDPLSAKQIDKMMKMYPVPRDANLRPERIRGHDRTREGCQLNRRAKSGGGIKEATAGPRDQSFGPLMPNQLLSLNR